MGKISQTAVLKLIFSVYRLLPTAQIKQIWTHDHLFYLDLDLYKDPPNETLSLLETEMGSIDPIQFREMMAANAAQLFHHIGQTYIAEQMQERGSELVSIAQFKNGFAPAKGDCLEEGVYKLLEWKRVDGVLRLNGIAASDKQKLKKILKKIESGKDIDHIKLGIEQNLFFEDDENNFLLTPRGSIVYEQFVSLWRTLNKPYITKAALHPDIAHAKVFEHLNPAELDLPLTLAQLQTTETQNKFLNGLFQSQNPTRDTTHIFTSNDQAQNELTSSLLFIDKTFMMLDFEVQWHLTLESQTFNGNQTSWKQGLQILKDALQAANIEWEPRSCDHDTHGPAAYITIPDAIGQRWEAGILALNLATPTDLQLKYQCADKRLHTPIMIMRSLFYSVERIIALQLENKNGLLPTWLAPEQVRILPIAERHYPQAEAALKQLLAAGVRAQIDLKTDPLGAKIHAAETARVPWMVVIGDQEVQNDSIAIRRCGEPQPRTGVKWDSFLREILAEISPGNGINTVRKGDQRVKLEDK